MATVNVTYYGMDGTGRTLTEAKRDAGRKIEAALSGYYSPTLVTWRGWGAIVFRRPEGWGYSLITDGAGEMRDGKLYGNTSCDDTEAGTIRAAQCHVADLAATVDDTDPPPFLTHKDDIAQWNSNRTFHRRYQAARAAGLNNHEAHTYGCGSLGRPDLVARVEGTPAAA